MFRKNKIIGVALLIGLLLPFESKAEGTELFQRFYSPKLALQTGKLTLSNELLWLSEETAQDSNKVIERPKAGFGIFALEFLGATTGGWIGFTVCLDMLAKYPSTSIQLSLVYLGILLISGPVGSASGVTLTGTLLQQEGSFGGALVGSAIGYFCCCSASLRARLPLFWPCLPLEL